MPLRKFGDELSNARIVIRKKMQIFWHFMFTTVYPYVATKLKSGQLYLLYWHRCDYHRTGTTWQQLRTLYHTLLHRNNKGNILEINYSKIKSWNRLHTTKKLILHISKTKVIQQRQTEANIMIKLTSYLQNYGTGARYTYYYLAFSWPQYK